MEQVEDLAAASMSGPTMLPVTVSPPPPGMVMIPVPLAVIAIPTLVSPPTALRIGATPVALPLICTPLTALAGLWTLSAELATEFGCTPMSALLLSGYDGVAEIGVPLMSTWPLPLVTRLMPTLASDPTAVMVGVTVVAVPPITIPFTAPAALSISSALLATPPG